MLSLPRTLLLLLPLLSLSAGESAVRQAAAAWPGLPKALPFVSQTWSGGRSLVWAKPGVSGSAVDPKNWLEDGKPATKVPDLDSDLQLPASETKYLVGLGGNQKGPDSAPPLLARCVSIGSGAALDGGTKVGDSWWGRNLAATFVNATSVLSVSGDVQVAKGGSLFARVRCVGKGHSVIVIDDQAHRRYWHDLIVAKEGDGSVTLLSLQLDLADGLRVNSGRLLLGPGCTLRWHAGFEPRFAQVAAEKDWRAGAVGVNDDRTSAQGYTFDGVCRIEATGSLELMDGSVLAPARAQNELQIDVLLRGRLLAGERGRPLTKNASVLLSAGVGEAGVMAAAGGIYVERGGSLVVTAAPGNKARLAFSALPLDKPAAGAGISLYLEPGLPAGLALEGLRLPGIYVPDVAVASKALKDCSLDADAGKAGSKLFGVLPTASVGGPGEVVLLDGRSLPCNVLFVHPNAPLLIVRPLLGGCLRSIPLALLHTAKVGAKTTPYQAKRAFTEAEKAQLAGALWAEDVGPGNLGRYGSERWEPTRTLIWARPGRSGNATTAGNWLEADGRPALDKPYGAIAPDLLLPSATTAYDALQPGNRDGLPCWSVRHLTLETNSGYGVCYAAVGNVWLRGGGDLGGNTQVGAFGSGDANRHTLLRVEGTNRSGGASAETSLSHWFHFDSGDKGSIEIVGRTHGPSDRGSLFRGTLVISEGSYLGNGDRASYFGRENTTTIVLQDGWLGHDHAVSNTQVASAGFDGTLMFGTPEHPLVRDMVFPLMRIDTPRLNRSAKPNERTAGASLVFGPKSKLVVNRRDPAITLTFTRQERAGVPADKAPNIALIFHNGQAPVANLVVDWLMPGGLMVKPEVAEAWKKLRFGSNCQGAPAQLISSP